MLMSAALANTICVGWCRATAVRDYLVAKGINAARVRTVSYGKERPVASGSDEAAWAKPSRYHSPELGDRSRRKRGVLLLFFA